MDARAQVAVSFVIPGDVVPWARAGGGKTTFKFTPKKQRNYGAVIKEFAATAMAGRTPIDGPCELKVCAYYPWPRSWSKPKRARCGGWKFTKPDNDNIVKIVKDAMNGIVYTDDARVAAMHVWKMFDDRPRLVVEVRGIT